MEEEGGRETMNQRASRSQGRGDGIDRATCCRRGAAADCRRATSSLGAALSVGRRSDEFGGGVGSVAAHRTKRIAQR